MLFIFKTMLQVFLQWIHLISGHRCVFGLVYICFYCKELYSQFFERFNYIFPVKIKNGFKWLKHLQNVFKTYLNLIFWVSYAPITLRLVYPVVRSFTWRWNRLPGCLISSTIWCAHQVPLTWPFKGTQYVTTYKLHYRDGTTNVGQ